MRQHSRGDGSQIFPRPTGIWPPRRRNEVKNTKYRESEKNQNNDGQSYNTAVKKNKSNNQTNTKYHESEKTKRQNNDGQIKPKYFGQIIKCKMLKIDENTKYCDSKITKRNKDAVL